MVKCADQIFALGKIHRNFSAHRGIHLSEKRGRDLYKFDPAQETGRGKSGKIADHAAAQCDDEIAAGNFCLKHRFVDLRKRIKTFGRFAVRQDKGMTFVSGKCLNECFSIQRKYVVIGDDKNLFSGKYFRNIVVCLA